MLEIPSSALAKVGASRRPWPWRGPPVHPSVIDTVARPAARSPLWRRCRPDALNDRRVVALHGLADARRCGHRSVRRRAPSGGCRCSATRRASRGRRRSRSRHTTVPTPADPSQSIPRVAVSRPAAFPQPAAPAAPSVVPIRGRRRVRPLTYRLRMAGVLAGAALVLGPGAAVAVEGSLYPVGAGPWAVTPQFSAIPLAGGQFQIQAPALNPAGGGNQWEMNWVCPVAGSEIHAVQLGALPHTGTELARAARDRSLGRRSWSLGDTGLPQSPELGRAYDVRLPGGQCNVHLALSQVEIHARQRARLFHRQPWVLVPGPRRRRSSCARSPPAGSTQPRVPFGWKWTTSDNLVGTASPPRQPRSPANPVNRSTRWATTTSPSRSTGSATACTGSR